MRRPEVCLFGEEAFGEAQRRLAGCIAGLHAAQPGATLALVTHGTVMALYLAALTGEDPFPLWQSLAMPAYAILDVAAGRRLHLVPALPPD
jgi:broad specificity phosphatase PhoE